MKSYGGRQMKYGMIVLGFMVAFHTQSMAIEYTFLLQKGVEVKIHANWDKNILEIQTKSKHIRLEKLPESLATFAKDTQREWKLFTFEDINFDGYTDIGVMAGYGYGGVNIYRDYYMYLPKKEHYEKVFSYVEELIVHTKEKLLESRMKSGMEFFFEYYRIDKEGKPYRIIKGNSFWLEDEESEMQNKYETKVIHVAKDRSYFYNDMGIHKTKLYIVKGDSVTMQALEADEKGVYWVYVAYEGKDKIFRKWVKMSDLAFTELDENIDNEEEYKEEEK